MKKFVLPVAFLLTAFAASAQNKTVFGVRGALNINSLATSSGYYSNNNFGNNPSSSSSTSTSGSLIGFSAGIFVEAPIAHEFSIQPELNYSLKGGKNTDGSFTEKTDLSYLTIPILAKYKPSVVKGFNVFIGPEFGFLVAAKDIQNDGNITKTDDIKNSLKAFDLGLDIGLGYDFLPNLGIDFRYGLGLTNISKDLGTNTYGNTTYHSSLNNRTIQFGIRYIFDK